MAVRMRPSRATPRADPNIAPRNVSMSVVLLLLDGRRRHRLDLDVLGNEQRAEDGRNDNECDGHIRGYPVRLR